jgi:hypothetical protein
MKPEYINGNKTASDDYLLTPQELCARWKNKISVGTLRNWRAKGKGPRPTKIGGSIFYMLREIENWETQQTMGKV